MKRTLDILAVAGLAISGLAGSAMAQEKCSAYVIQQGDSLRDIAWRVYGTADYRAIYDANRQAIGENPDTILIGTTIDIPCSDGTSLTTIASSIEPLKIELGSSTGSAEAIAIRAEAVEIMASAQVSVAEAQARIANAETQIANVRAEATELTTAATAKQAESDAQRRIAEAERDTALAKLQALEAELVAARESARAEIAIATKAAAVAEATAMAAAKNATQTAAVTETTTGTTIEETVQTVAMVKPAATPEAVPLSARQASLISGNQFAPYADESLPNRGVFTKLVETAFLRAAPEQAYKIQFVNDWNAHTDLLMPTLAIDATFPWAAPNCEMAGEMTPEDQKLCSNYLFSDPFYEIVDTFFAKVGSGFEATMTAADFAGATICRAEGRSLTHLNAVGLSEPAITLYRPTDPDECFIALIEDRVDLVAMDANMGVEAIERLDFSFVIAENPNLAAIVPMSVMVHADHPDSAEMLDILNEGLGNMQQTGEWRDIVSKALAAHTGVN